MVLSAFVVDYMVKVLYLWFYNTSGYDVLVYLSLVLDVCTRTLTRILTILVCMGYVSFLRYLPTIFFIHHLIHPSYSIIITITIIIIIIIISSLGISRASITDQTLKLVLFALAYFAINIWDSFLAAQPAPDPSLSKIRVYSTAG